MAIADRLTKLTTDITNAYASIENKGGTIPANKNTNNLSTAIDSIQSSNIIGATAEGESLSLANTKAMPYSDYVVKGKSEQEGEPSPSNPSEIHSVADDDINIFNAEKIENYNIKVKDNGKTIIMPVVTSGNGNTNTATKLNVLCPDLQVGDVIYIRFKRNLNNNRNHFIYLYGSNKIMYASENSPSYTITQEDLNSYVFLYGNDYDYGETEQCIITDFKIQKNTVPINYSPYNQGTVTIKQRGTTESNDYVLQTSPLRSLPNGVKDTIEAEQHRKIGKQTGTLTETTTITLSDAKTNGAYMCNIKPSGTLTGKTIELEAGDYEIIYELEEEIMEPLTQNQATTMLDIIKTGSYEGTTNIYTDEDVKPTIEVDYYKYGETGGLPTVENEKLIFDKELQIDREELIF